MIHQIMFDDNNRFVILRGKTHLQILNIHTMEERLYQLDTLLYSEINNLRFKSTDDDHYKCYITAIGKESK